MACWQSKRFFFSVNLFSVMIQNTRLISNSASPFHPNVLEGLAYVYHLQWSISSQHLEPVSIYIVHRHKNKWSFSFQNKKTWIDKNLLRQIIKEHSLRTLSNFVWGGAFSVHRFHIDDMSIYFLLTSWLRSHEMLKIVPTASKRQQPTLKRSLVYQRGPITDTLVIPI